MTRRKDRGRNSARGFTLVELLAVIAVILVLLSLLLPAGNWLRLKARCTSTGNRMSAIVQALGVYARGEGSSCAVLQRQIPGLGGVADFVSLRNAAHICMNPVDGDLTKRDLPPSVGWYIWPPAFIPKKYLANPPDTYDYLWLRMKELVDTVLEVRPPDSGKTEAFPNSGLNGVPDGEGNFDNWFTRAWPMRWPMTNWETVDTSMPYLPPILAYPWGRPGLFIRDFQGSHAPVGICDPQLAPSTEVGRGLWADGGWPHPRDRPYTNSAAFFGAGKNRGSFTDFYSMTELRTEDLSALLYLKRSDTTQDPPYRSFADDASNGPMPFDMGLFSPLKTIPLLQAAGILPPGDARDDAIHDGGWRYRQDRDADKPWNDVWGNPLVVSYALFQPVRHFNASSLDTRDLLYCFFERRDIFLLKAKEAYGYDRALYVTVGSIGPEGLWDGTTKILRPTWYATEDVDVLRKMWLQIRGNCHAEKWDENTFVSQKKPWEGFKADKASSHRNPDGTSRNDAGRIGSDCTCLLLSPKEIR